MNVFYKEEQSINKLSNELKKFLTEDTLIVCIGTDRSIADALAPIVGTKLIENNCKYKVFGTLENPIHALNVIDYINKIKKEYPNNNILAIDASLSNSLNPGDIKIRNYGVKPGAGLKKELPLVGDKAILGIVDYCYKDMDESSFRFNNIRLSFIMEMANVITNSILNV